MYEDEPRTWAPHPIYTELMVSDYGEVFNSRTDHLLTPCPNGSGRMQVKYASVEGVYTSFMVHRLVAETHLEGFDFDYNVLHDDGDYSNNWIGNLLQGEVLVRGKVLV